jgi:hypothetical protein
LMVRWRPEVTTSGRGLDVIGHYCRADQPSLLARHA